MTEASFASLSPGLLARKGGAKPAMRPQLAAVLPAQGSGEAAAANLEDLGWNDMGDDGGDRQEGGNVLQLTPEPTNEAAEAEAREHAARAEKALESAAIPMVKKQQDSLAEQVASAKKAVSLKAAPKAASKGKRAAFTLRLDPERHLKLRLACTLTNRSAQQIVTDALDAKLGEMPELDALAAQVAPS